MDFLSANTLIHTGKNGLKMTNFKVKMNSRFAVQNGTYLPRISCETCTSKQFSNLLQETPGKDCESKNDGNVRINGGLTTFDDFSSESSDDNDWTDASAEKEVANSNPTQATRIYEGSSSQMPSAAEPKIIKILGSATIPKFPDDEKDLQVIDIDSE